MHEVGIRQRIASFLGAVERGLGLRRGLSGSSALTEQMLSMLKKSVDVAPEAVFWLDDQGRFVYVNESAGLSLQYSTEELLRMRLFDVNPASSLDGWADLLSQIRRAGSVRLESVHRRRDGTVFPVEILSTHVVFAGREYVNGFARDISERAAAERALRERIAELSALRSTALDITSPHELPSLLRTIVERAARLIDAEAAGLYRCDAAARQARCVVSYRTPKNYVGTVLRYGEGASGTVAESGRPLLIPDYGEWPGRAAAFEEDRPFRSVLAVPMLWHGEVTGVIDAMRLQDQRPFTPDDLRLLTLFADHAAIAQENARLREGLEQELVQHRRMEEARLDLERRMLSAQKLEGLGLLAGGVAHDFNNMLAVILGFAELLRARLPAGSEESSHVAEILTAAERSRALTRQLLAIGQRQALEMKPVDLNRVIRGSESLLRHTLRESTTIAVRCAPLLDMVMADQGQVEQVILNLAANAQEAMPRGGTLTIETRGVEVAAAAACSHGELRPGPYVVLLVTDTGAGIAPETLPRIFDPFFTTKGEGKGTGLGLPTVYGIVKQHGGAIDVTSAPGEGTSFRIYFPRAAGSSPAGRPEEVPEDRRGEETVLVVEDQDQLRALVGRVLRARGYTVLDAKSADGALDMASGHAGPLHLLVTDVVLEGQNGRELFARLVQERRGLKVLYMSGYPRDVLSGQGILEEEADLIQKPFSLPIFAAKVRQVLDRS
jgi:two-component system, cell cycle sensor histidine kinase and response regulator CckA